MIYDFAGFSLDTARMELRRGQDVLALEPRAFQLLQLLVENVDRVVSKDDITDAIWPNVHVTDASISTAIRQIRKVLGDDGSSQSIIKTVRGIGFRLVAPVQMRPPANVTSISPTVDAPEDAPIDRANNQPVVAVLPFRLLGADVQQTAIAEAIPSELIATLSRLRWIKVIARGSSFRFGDTDANLDEVRRKVGATYALTGVVELQGPRVTVIVELADTRSGNVVWSDSFQGGLDDVYGMRAKVARNVVTALELRVPLNEADRLALAPTESLDAWGHYHLGVRHMYRYNRTDNLVAEAHFKKAVALDPQFARANAGLSYTEFQNFFQQFGHDPEHHKSLALSFAERGVDLDPLDPFCNLILGRAKWLFGEVDDGLGWITRSVDLNPNYSFGYYNRATLNTVLCEADTADDDVETALTLSPIDPHLQSMYGTRALAAFVRDEMDDAVHYAERAMRSPNAHLYVYMIAAAIHGRRGDLEKANLCVEHIRRKNVPFGKQDFLSHFNLRDTAKLDVLKQSLAGLGI